MVRRHELTDSQWRLIEPILPGKAGDPGRTGKDNRLFVNAVLFVLKTGIPWSDLPERYGNPNSVWRRFDRWCANGVWERIFVELADDELLEELEEVHLDSSTVKAHQVASTGRRHPGEKKSKPMSDDVWDVAEED
jgi:putative transposase